MEPLVNPNEEITFIYGEPPVELQQSKMLMLTKGKIAILGSWHNCVGVIGWYPLPNRDKQKEEELGIL